MSDTPRTDALRKQFHEMYEFDDDGGDSLHHLFEKYAELERELAAEREHREKVLELAIRYGGIDGEHHKTWVIDQVVRALAADEYEKLIADAKAGEDGPDTYGWDEGIAP